MVSSMLAGERRWASARRGGMTVLGKVAVPKPINLPSQRLENHGLDPNTEIVPKGTHSWGNRSSSSNPWGSSTLSPNAEGSTGSSSHVSGRPSSGGSVTRPSTAGSEPAASAWGQSSRPSSASGPLISNQTSLTSSRPRSAETRPNSSQLSRFAEPVVDNPVAWGSNSTSEKMTMGSKNDGFSLSSGDFPTLGTERDNSSKDTELPDHGSHVRPGSASGRLAQGKDAKSGTVNTWTRDGSQHVEDGAQPGTEKWHGNHQQYFNPNIPPHFDAWRGPPMNATGGAWYRGPPYPPGAHGGFPMEPFPYYRPQIPPPALANSQPIPPQGVGPRAHHPIPNNGDFYRPQMPDAFIRPGMPIRPGFFPGPVPYDGYYGPPVGYNHNERDVPFMAMPPGPHVYNMYPSHNPSENNDAHARAGGPGSMNKMVVNEQSELGHSEDLRGPYKVLTKKPPNAWDAEEGEGSSDLSPAANVLHQGKDDRSRAAYERGADSRRNADVFARREIVGPNSTSRNLGNQLRSSDSVLDKPSEFVGDPKSFNDNWRKKSERPTPSTEMPPVLPATQKDSTLMQKIEFLNAKKRASDGREDGPPASFREDQNDRLHVGGSRVNKTPNEVGSLNTSGNFVPLSQGVGVSKGAQPLRSTSANVSSSRKTHQGMQERVSHVNERFNNQDADGWSTKPAPLTYEPSADSLAPNVAQDRQHISTEAVQKSEAKNEAGSLKPMFDPEAQRAKMREVAKQRALQLQKEEEERIREQKAKALAKLEELNRRTLAADTSAQKQEKPLYDSTAQRDSEGAVAFSEEMVSSSENEVRSPELDHNPLVFSQTSESSTIVAGASSDLSRNQVVEMPLNSRTEPAITVGQSSPSKLETDDTVGNSKSTPLVNDAVDPKQRRTAPKKQSTQMDKSSVVKSIPDVPSEPPKDDSGVIDTPEAPVEVVPTSETNLTDRSSAVHESSGHQRKKNKKSGRNKHKVDDASMLASEQPSPLSKETLNVKDSAQSGKTEAAKLDLDQSNIQLVADIKVEMQPNSEQNSSVSVEDVRVSNQKKPQQPRKMPRNPQANRSSDRFHGSDAVVWTPVRSHSKTETEEGAYQGIPHDSTSEAKSSNQISSKSKRAEIERYVPKPAAKEQAQQGSIQQIGKTMPGGSHVPVESSSQPVLETGNDRSIVEPKGGDSKQKKQVKTHGAWRQRGHGFQQGSSEASILSKNIQKSVEQHETSNISSYSVPAETKVTHDWDPSDGWHIPEYPAEAAPVSSVVKEQGGLTGRGKKPAYKGQRNMENSHDRNLKYTSREEVDTVYTKSSSVETCQLDTAVHSKESRASHWQPKSQTYSANDQRGNRSSGGQNVNSGYKQDSPNRGRPHHPTKQYGDEDIPQFHPGNSERETRNVRKPPFVGHQESRREMRPVSSKVRQRSPNEGFVNTEQQVPIEQDMSSGYRKTGNHNRRSGQGNEYGGDWVPSDHEGMQQNNAPMYRERQRQNSHYEYQPVGPNSNNRKFSNFDGPPDHSRNSASRYRDRGPGQPRRGGGNFYGRYGQTEAAGYE